MPGRFTKLASAAGLGAMILALTGSWGAAQPEPIPLFPPGAQPPPAAAQPDPNAQPAPGQGDVEVLAKGPVHEAFAATAEAPVASPVVAKQPPDPIEELPPDQKPEGDNVQWIPGYWHWDDDSSQYIWISGFWRQPPPGRVWVPGSFRQVEGGWQWVSGFWQEVNPLPAPGQDQQQVQPEIVYLPQPPASLETGPTVPAPTVTSVYVPGSWVWRGRYVWRPGVWIGYNADWVWVPAHFVWTPMGYVFVEGYWDYVLARRGMLFAPVIVPQAVYARPGFLYTPTFVVSEPAMLGALFVRRGYTNYFFGDYFGNRYATGGYRPWAGRVANGNFALGFGTGRNWGYDPLWGHYSVAHRADRQWQTNFANLYEGRYTGKVARPPVNLAQQNTAINKIANTNVNNVTNNITVVNKTVTVNKQDVTALAMVAPVSLAPKLQPEAKIKPVAADVRRAEAQAAKQLRAVGQERAKLEVPHAAATPGAKLTQPKAVKIEVPKALVARAHPQDQKKAPPPAPIKADQRADHTLTPKGEPKAINPKAEPKITPKGEPRPQPKVTPKGEPKVNPKGEPKGEPFPNPKAEPKPKEPPPKAIPPAPKAEPPTPLPKGNPPTPKAEPKHEPIPHPRPKGEPPPAPKVNPPAPQPIPKVEPRPPQPIPKVEPRPVPPQPIPKVAPPRPKVEPPLPKANPPAPKGPPPPAPKVEPKHEPKKEEPPRKGPPL
jgi:hypothetical protein